MLDNHLVEGNYSTYGKCVNVTCGNPDTVAVYDGRGRGAKMTCEFIGRPNPLCSFDGAMLVNLHGEGKQTWVGFRVEIQNSMAHS